MNRVELIGRLTKDLELKKTQTGISVVEFNLAVNNITGNADFIRCVAWKQSAEYLTKYSKKGSKIGLEGRISTRSYDGKNGKQFITEIVAERVEILDSKKEDPKHEVPAWDGYESNTPKMNGEDIDNLPFY